MKDEKIWYEDFNVLIDRRKLCNYIPLKSYTKNEKLNAIMRLAIYISIVLILVTFDLNYAFVLIIAGILTYVVNSSIDSKNDKKFEKTIENYSQLKKDKHIKNNNIDVKKYVKKCTLPSEDNPFMNFLVSDKRNKKPACKSTNDKKVEKLVEDKFNIGLFKDINSVYNNENSQREFYTMPNTAVVNDQEGLGKWLYLTPKTCKEGNGNQCVGNNQDRLNGSSYYFV